MNNINDNLRKSRVGFFQDPLTWMVYHSVSANLIMVILLGLGLVLMLNIKKTVFPDFQRDSIDILVNYPGSSVSNLETAVAIPIENAISNVDNIGDVKTEISDEEVHVNVEILNNSYLDSAYRDLENKVNSITSFPSDMPRPMIMKRQSGYPLIYIMLYGEDVNKAVLKQAMQFVRNIFAQNPDTGIITIPGDEDYEIRVEVSENTLRKYNLTLEEIGRIIESSGMDITAGTLRSDKEKVELRFNYHKEVGNDFDDIVIKTSPQGDPLYLKDIARIYDAFDDNTDVDIALNNKLSTFFYISAKEGQTPIQVSKAVNKAVGKTKKLLPPGLDLEILYDSTNIFNERAYILFKEGGMGVLLVILILSLFLEWRLALWTSFGIPISFLGSFLILTPIMAPLTDFSINIISLFAFIIVLGIVIDDAIVVGENIYSHKDAMPDNSKLATANGVKEVASSAFFSIFTNIVAFLPLTFLPGTIGKFFRQIPIVVIVVLLISLFESLFILPARISFKNKPPSKNIFAKMKSKFNEYFDILVNTYYINLLRKVIKYRYVILSVAFSILILFIAYIKSGRMGIILMPEAENDLVSFNAIFPASSTLETKINLRRILVDNALTLLNNRGGKKEYVAVESDIIGPEMNIRIFLQPASTRPYGAKFILEEWQEKNGELVGLQEYSYSSSISMPGGNAQITMEISHPNSNTLGLAVADIVDSLSKFNYVTHVETDMNKGYKRLNITLTELGYALGLNPIYVGNQIKNYIYGYKALEQVRERNTQKVMVRLPKNEINSSNSINNFVIKTPNGKYIPLSDVVNIVTNYTEPKISRLNYQRNVEVYTYINLDNKSSEILNKFLTTDLPRIQQQYPGLDYHMGGRQKEMLKVGKALLIGMILTLIIIYVALAMFFDSYIQPIIIMIAIPFGFIGAIIGHIVMGFSLSIPSMFGLLALSGVVVNASMIIIYFTNVERRNSGISGEDSVIEVCRRRFRPILLTALTAFFGMLPTIVSTSSEVAFLRPIAVALGFGVIFATLITLICMPVFYLVLDDMKNFFRRVI